MAYADVVSLIQTLKQLMQQKPSWIIGDTRKMIESLLNSAEYFQNFLEKTYMRRQVFGNFEELERVIRIAVNDVENVIELTMHEYNLLEHCSRLGLPRQPLCDDLPPLVEKIDFVKRRMMRFVTNDQDLSSGVYLLGHSSSRRVASLNLENVVVGLEDDLMKVMRRLTGPPSSREIVSIVGMGGIGKTTLAKKVYHHPEVRNRFDVHIWVTISQEYQTRDLLLCILSCIFQLKNEIQNETYRLAVGDEINESSDDQLMDMIYKKLKYRRYLVIVDDIWSTGIWDLMTRFFPDDNNGSRIILTSRHKEVAEHADPDSNPHEMSLLNSDNSWKLLHDKVFGSQHDVCPRELEKIGKQVAQKCQGLPLALLVVAGHLSKMPRTRECWDDVAKTISKIVASEPDKCIGVLAMSYSYLPHHLKACFLSIGVFPEDFVIATERLIQLWVAEGFLRHERLKSMEQVGKECLEDLISRNLILVRKRRFNGELITCGVHDLVRDLILRQGEKEKFLKVTRTHDVITRFIDTTSKPHVHRYSSHSRISQGDCWNSTSSLTRTMYLFNGLKHAPRPSKQIPFLARFKLLRVLAILHYTFQDFPLEITKLLHLRYLEFNCRDDLHCSVSELYNLQNLIFGRYSDLPVEIWKMKLLRHLERLKLHGAWEECRRDTISQMLNSLYCLTQLEILKIICSRKLYPHPLPSKYVLPTSLVRLTLRCTYLPWEDMANIIVLPNLQVLKIKDNGFDGDAWRLSDEQIFNQLKYLLIDRTNVKSWKAGSVNFPKLQHLVLKRCIYLEEIPKDIGEVYTLESIELLNCRTSAAKSVKEIQEEQESMGNDCLSVRIHDKPWWDH